SVEAGQTEFTGRGQFGAFGGNRSIITGGEVIVIGRTVIAVDDDVHFLARIPGSSAKKIDPTSSTNFARASGAHRLLAEMYPAPSGGAVHEDDGYDHDNH